MRPGQQKQRGRNRNNNNGGGGGNNNNNNNRKGGNPLSRSYDSTGPDVKIRGTAQHIAEKYATLARDAQSAGDNVMAENYLQHAEHYNRIIAAAQAQMQERYQRNERDNDRDGDDRDGGYAGQQNDQDEGDQDELGDGQSHRANGHVNGANGANGARHMNGRHNNNQERNGERRDRRDQRGDRDHQAPRQDRIEAAADDEQPDIQFQPPARFVPQPQASDDVHGTGPQPVIDGIPAEVAAEESSEAAPRKRTPRPRRPRAAKAETAAADGDAPAAAESDAG
jgi:hypothetical protein